MVYPKMEDWNQSRDCVQHHREVGSHNHGRETNRQRKRQRTACSQGREFFPHNQHREIAQISSQQQARSCAQYPPSRDIASHHQNQIGSYVQGTTTQSASQLQQGVCISFESANMEHSKDRAGGQPEEDNFINLYKDKYTITSGYRCDQQGKRYVDFCDHHMQKDKPRRPFQGNNSFKKPNYLKDKKNYRGDASYQARHGAQSQNRLDQEASLDMRQWHMDDRPGKNNAHSCSISHAKYKPSDSLNESHWSQTDRFNVNPSFVGKRFNPAKNFLEPFPNSPDFMEDEDEEEDDGDDYGSDSEEAEVEEKAYHKMFPKVKEFVETVCGSVKPSLVDKVELECLVCPTSQHFKGWKALLSHALHFRKRKTAQHRGYHRALENILRAKEDEGQGQEEEVLIAARASFIDPTISEVHFIVWPPVVIIENAAPESHGSQSRANSKDTQVTQEEGTRENMVIGTLLSQEFRDLHPQDIISCGEGRFVILFEASSVGYMEAKVMNDRFHERKRGREDWMCYTVREHSSLSRDCHGTMQLLFGYLAEPTDLRTIDPNKTIVKDWSEESYQEKVQGANKRMKKEHEDKQAKLRAMELEVVTLVEDEQNFKIHKQALWHQIEIKQMEIEEQQERTQKMQEKFAEEESRLIDKFKVEMELFDKKICSYERELKEQLDKNEKLLEEERISRMRQIERRRLELTELKEDYKKLAEQKALDRESEVMARRKNFMAEVQKTEADFNEKIRTMESSLQDKQQEEMMKLVEESNREREAFYKEWLKEQEILKREAEEARKRKEQLQKENVEQEMTSECMVCWDDLTPENRALLDPCGHARLCIGCAKEVYKTRKECPLCRQKIAKKPIVCPKSLLSAS